MEPIGGVSAPGHRSTRKSLMSLASSMEVITPTLDENNGLDIESERRDNDSHRQRATSSRCSVSMDDSMSGEVREGGRESVPSCGPMHKCRRTLDHARQTAGPCARMIHGPLSRAQRQVMDLLLCTQVDGLTMEVRQLTRKHEALSLRFCSLQTEQID